VSDSPDFKLEADQAGRYPDRRFGKRERKLLESVQEAFPFATKLVGSFETVAGSDTQTVSIPGLKAGDKVLCQFGTAPAFPVTILSASASTASLSLSYSSDPGAGLTVNYFVFRAS